MWAVGLRERLPIIGVPLRGDDPDVPLDLQQVLAAVIERGSYDLDADYANDPVPPLASDAAAWAREVIAANGSPAVPRDNSEGSRPA